MPVAVGAIVATAAAFAVFVVASAHADSPFTRPRPPPGGGAFASGGVPAHDPAIEAALVTQLAPAVAGIAADRWALEHLRDTDAMIAHGSELASAWRGLAGALAAWSSGGGEGGGEGAGEGAGDRGGPDAPIARRRTDELAARLDVLSDQLAAAGLGYYLHSELARRAVGVYRVDDVAFVRAGRDRIRVLGVRELGHAAGGAIRLGMKPEELGDPIVLLDNVDDKITTQILPVLAGAAFPLGDAGWAGSARGAALARAAGGAIREELVTALGSDAHDPQRAAVRCLAIIAASVRHHEAQHAVDQAHRLDEPAALAHVVNERADSPMSLRATYELSAYVSQLASDVWLPQLVLWNLARHAFHDQSPRTAEQLVAVVVVEGLAARLGIASPGPVIHGGLLDRDRLAALLAPIAARSTAELRTAAAALWGDLYGGKLVRLVDD